MTTLLDIQASFLPVVFLWGLLWLVTPWIRSNNTVLRRGVFLLFCALQALYFWWRISTTWEAEGLQGVYAAVILFLEIVLLYPTYELMKQLQRTRSRSAEADAYAGWYLADGRPPRVDILIPTYNESWPILEKTVVGALAQDYPNVRVWVCDDGRRQWLKEAVESIGGHYTTR